MSGRGFFPILRGGSAGDITRRKDPKKGQFARKMTAKSLQQELESFARNLEEHIKLYNASFGPYGGEYPEENLDELGSQGIRLIRSLGRLRPFLEHFDKSWIVGSHGTSWNILDSGLSMQSIGLVRGPSMVFLSEKIHGIIGRLSMFQPDDSISLDAGPTGLGDNDLVRYLCSRISRAARVLKHRSHGKPPFEVADEYDVQDLLHSLLRGYVKHAVKENPLPKVAGGPSSRADICIEDLGILIEVKYVRSPSDQKAIMKQLSEDMVFYTAWEHLRFLIFLVYNADDLSDPESLDALSGEQRIKERSFLGSSSI